MSINNGMSDIKFNFGNRRLQKIRNTFVLSLPVDWIRNANIEKGSSLRIEMLEDHSLRIIPN